MFLDLEKRGFGQLIVKDPNSNRPGLDLLGRTRRNEVFMKPNPENLAANHFAFSISHTTLSEYQCKFRDISSLPDKDIEIMERLHPEYENIRDTLVNRRDCSRAAGFRQLMDNTPRQQAGQALQGSPQRQSSNNSLEIASLFENSLYKSSVVAAVMQQTGQAYGLGPSLFPGQESVDDKLGFEAGDVKQESIPEEMD